VNSASFSPDGKRVVTASSDHTARVWDLSGPQPVSTVLAGHSDGVNTASFSPDGKRVVTASSDGTARVWDLSGPQPVSTVLAGHLGWVRTASFSPAGKRVVTASYDNTAVIWPTPEPEVLIPVAKRAVTRCLTVAQRDSLGLPIIGTPQNDRETVRQPPC
jgi:WD40 repeat protein